MIGNNLSLKNSAYQKLSFFSVIVMVLLFRQYIDLEGVLSLFWLTGLSFDIATFGKSYKWKPLIVQLFFSTIIILLCIVSGALNSGHLITFIFTTSMVCLIRCLFNVYNV